MIKKNHDLRFSHVELESQMLAHSELFQKFTLYLLVATFVDASNLDPDKEQ